MEISEIMRGMQPTIATPSAAVEPAPPESAGTAKTTMAVPPRTRTKRRPGRAVITVVVLAALSTAAWFIFRGKGPEPTGPGPAAPARRAAPTRPAPTRPAETKPAPKPAVAVDASPAAAAAQVDTKPPESHAPAPPAVAQEDEEDLLKNAEPESSDRVIGEEEGVRQHKPRKPPVVGKEPPAAVSVRITSSPEGAVVSLGRRVFGRAPINLRFRPGISYELTFVKKGYVSTTRRFTVTSRANQSVKAVLRQKPVSTPKRSLFRRIFGK
jgi:hypothetical protein